MLQNKLQVTVHITWVPETFLARLPLVALAYGRSSVGLRPTPKIPAAREKKPLVPRVPYKVLPNESKNLCTATSNPFSLSRLCSGENEWIPLSLLILLSILMNKSINNLYSTVKGVVKCSKLKHTVYETGKIFCFRLLPGLGVHSNN